MIRFLILFFLVFSRFGFACGIDSEDSAHLRDMFEEDQSLRRSEVLDFKKIIARGEYHRGEVRKMAAARNICTANDFFHSALIMQHGENFEDYRLAISLAQMASIMSPDDVRYRWLIAAAWDRAMLSKGRPQWYGTQYTLGEDGNKVYEQIDGDVVNNEEREYMGLEGNK